MQLHSIWAQHLYGVYHLWFICLFILNGYWVLEWMACRG